MSNTITGLSLGNISWNSDLKVENTNKTNSDQDGVRHDGKTPQAMPLPLPNLASKPDMMKMMAAFEDLIILMSKMAKEIQKGERESELASLAAKISMLMSAAQEKKEGADKMMSQAVASLVISVVSAAISIGAGALSFKGAIDGLKAASKAGAGVEKGAAEAVKAAKASQTVGNTFGTTAKIASATDKTSLAAQKVTEGAKAFQAFSSKFTALGTIADGVGKGVGAGAGYTSSLGQAESQRAQARSDEMQARAEEVGAQAQKSQQMQQDMRDLMNKMTELLQAFYAAQDKIANAAAH